MKVSIYLSIYLSVCNSRLVRMWSRIKISNYYLILSDPLNGAAMALCVKVTAFFSFQRHMYGVSCEKMPHPAATHSQLWATNKTDDSCNILCSHCSFHKEPVCVLKHRQETETLAKDLLTQFDTKGGQTALSCQPCGRVSTDIWLEQILLLG